MREQVAGSERNSPPNQMRRTLKLRTTSIDELRVRGSQAFAAFAERRSWSSQTRQMPDKAFLARLDPSRFEDRRLVSPLELRDYFGTRIQPAFFAAFYDPEATVAELRRRWPEAEARIIGQSDRILNGRFDLLGLHNLDFGNPIDWHFEPVAGKRPPLLHWSRLNYLDSGRWWQEDYLGTKPSPVLPPLARH